MAARYYAKLHREFAIIDLSHDGVCGLRWRTEREVIDGKGEVWCGARKCDRKGVVTYELPFSYRENGENKLELVKVRVCEACGRKVTALAPPSKKRKRR